MASSSKQTRGNRRSGKRTAAVWHGTNADAVRSSDRAISSHGTRRRVQFSWRWMSALIVLAMIGVLALFFIPQIFYVHTIAVGGLETISKEEIFYLSGVADYHIFWVDPKQVEANLVDYPTISEAQVRLGWPPQMVQIIIRERQPAVIWQQAGIERWIDLQGRVMQLRQARDDLITISYDGLASRPLEINDVVPVDVVNGALQLHTLFPDMNTFRYSPDFGLGFPDNRGWQAWFGVGTDMPNRVLIYNALVEDLLSRGIQPNVVSVADPDSVYYAGTWGR